MKPIEELGISPTPWELDIGGSCCWVEARGGATVCSTAASETRDCEADTANARLIASAPGLYEALLECLSVLVDVEKCFHGVDKRTYEIMGKAKAALEKAGGEK